MIKIVYLLVFIVSVSINTTFSKTPKAIMPPGLVEIINDELKVSGVYMVGLMIGKELPSANTNLFYVWLPEMNDGYLCVTVRSVDGVYNGVINFNNNETKAGIYPLIFETTKADTIKSYGPGELILDGRIGMDCNDKKSLSHVPMSWTDDIKPKGADSDTIIFFINADGHDSFILAPLKSNKKKFISLKCEDLPKGKSQRVFSAYCMIENPDQLDMTRAWLELRRFGKRVAWEELVLTLP